MSSANRYSNLAMFYMFRRIATTFTSVQDASSFLYEFLSFKVQIPFIESRLPFIESRLPRSPVILKARIDPLCRQPGTHCRRWIDQVNSRNMGRLVADRYYGLLCLCYRAWIQQKRSLERSMSTVQWAALGARRAWPSNIASILPSLGGFGSGGGINTNIIIHSNDQPPHGP